MVGIDLQKLVDNCLKACSSVNALIVLSWALSRGIQLPEGIEQHDIKLTQTEHQLVYKRSEFMTSPVLYVWTEFRGD